jgi:homoserine O-acetyltransferase/O-succinyltransferase
MFRYMAMQSIRDDPAWDNGNYTHEPIEGLRGAADFLIIAGSAPQQMQKDFPTRQRAEDYVNRTVNATVARSRVECPYLEMICSTCNANGNRTR